MCDFISGEKLQQLCDVYIGCLNDLNYNPKISIESYKHFDIDKFNTEWDNPKLIFCYSGTLIKLINKLHLFKNKFILVSHNGDDNITEQYLPIANHPIVIKWFSQNIMINHPKVILLPIGIANSMWKELGGNVDNYLIVKKITTENQISKENKIYFNFSVWTNPKERELCKNVIESKGLIFENNVSHLEYLNKLSKCKFAISPPGNGIDCHRIWECYYFNVIPILLRSTFTENLSKILPCVILNNWNEFNYDEIIIKYDEMNSLLNQKNEHIKFNYYKELILNSKKSKMNIVYCFIGTLNMYCVDTVHQLRLFYDEDVYFIISDYNSHYLPILKDKYNVKIINYDDVISQDFQNTVNNYRNKFLYVNGLTGRELLFIYSFERFFVLHNLMKNYELSNVLFLELDNTLYDDPRKWEDIFSKDIGFMFDHYDRCSSGICYVKNYNILNKLNDSFLNFIQTSKDFIYEMGALYKFWENNKDNVELIPIIWETENVSSLAYENYHKYNNSIFDAAALGIYLTGVDPYHTNGIIVKGTKNPHSMVDYTKYKYKWEVDEKGRNIPYILNEKTNIWNRINNLHIHSKNLKEYVSIKQSTKFLDFIEIGTSDFDTEVQKNDCGNGISIEPISFYLNKLPNKINVEKLNIAISDKEGFVNVYYINEENITLHNLPWWTRGCNSINDYHPTVIREVKQKGLDPAKLYTIEKIPVKTLYDLFIEKSIENVYYLKIDTEGHDCVILKKFMIDIENCKILPPFVIRFESNILTHSNEIQDVIKQFHTKGYELVSSGEDTILHLNLNNIKNKNKFTDEIVGYYIPTYPLGYDPKNPGHENTLESAKEFCVKNNYSGITFQDGRYEVRIGKTIIKNRYVSSWVYF